ncbi:MULTISPECIES: DUF2140 family protein [unclassified Jeotgalibaca]|uniref:DUF2140 family protein n=1 Tax=unclassified Jeotgalibaca TaxID=2621505 RepID=UPI003FD5B755
MFKQRGKRSNAGWKWAFILLLSINIGAIFYALNLLKPIDNDVNEIALENKSTVSENDKDTIAATITLENKDLEELLQFAISENSATERVPQIKISDQALLVLGELSVFGFETSYQIEADPFAMEDGNLQLKVNDVKLGKLTLPIAQVLQLLATQLDAEIPILIDSKAQMIIILLSEIQTDAIQRIKLEKIDKDVAEYTFIITITKENLLQ